ncbi:MAG TPA: BatD family protein [Candidatus Kapabacteria bacterium]|nr:BatD family protein [Candidatus Kapabacteria bacterium]
MPLSRSTKVCFCLLGLALLLLVPAPIQAAVTVSANVDHPTIMAGETVNLSVTIEGGAPQSAENFPPIQGLTIQYRGPAQSITSINGQTTIRHTLNYSVSAPQPGQFTIPAIKVYVDGTAYPTTPVRLTVAKADPSVQNRSAFLRLTVPKTEVYVGEIIPVDLQLYVIDAENMQAPQLKSDGFVIHKQLEHTTSRAQIGNVLYSVLTFRMSVSAAKAGKLTLGPAEMNLVLRVRVQPDPNDVFGFFGRYQRRSVTISSPTVELNVLPLPSPAPAEFTGAIGVFNWTVNVGPTNLTGGDPITIRATITGRGNFDNVKLPEFNWPEFRTYPPTSSTALSDQLGIDGAKTFEQVVVPQGAAANQLPALTFAYFDPAKKEFVTLEHSATPLQVKQSPNSSPSIAVASPNGGTSNEEPAARSDIVHIKTDPGTLAALSPPLVRQPWFLLLHAIPLGAVVGLTVWRKKQDHLARNPKLRRKLEVQQVVQGGLTQLRHHANAQQAEEFYALLFRLIQEQIGERLDLPASAITEAVLDERLPRRGASPELINRLHQLFRISNQARYAPVKTDTELLQLSSDLEKALSELQQLPD